MSIEQVLLTPDDYWINYVSAVGEYQATITPDGFIGSIMSLLFVSIEQVLLTSDDYWINYVSAVGEYQATITYTR